jgi:hypothetical protein
MSGAFQLARRFTMVLQKLAAIALRPHGFRRIGMAMLAAVVAVGCSHSRQSYRPVFTTPVRAAAPCTNCGSGAAVTTEVPGTAPTSAVPSEPEYSVPDSPPASVTVPPRQGAGATRSSTVESPPKSRLGDEPAFEETGSGAAGTATPPPPPKPVGPKAGPPLQGPSAALEPTTSNRDLADGEIPPLASPKRVKRASLSERLRPFVDDSSANELVYPNKADRPWKYIVLHHSATPSGSYDQIDGEHRKVLGFDGCGYHFVIGNGTGSGDGQIEVAQRWTKQKQGVHCRNARSHDVDEYGIGICLVGNFDQQQPTPRQVAAAQALIAYLSQRYTIASSRVETHSHVAATATACPGKYFPSETILSTTRNAMSRPPVRTTWKVVRDTRS